jgi:hypothetical protein
MAVRARVAVSGGKAVRVRVRLESLTYLAAVVVAPYSVVRSPPGK